MSKPHLIIIGGRVHTFEDRQAGRAMRLRILQRVVSHTRNVTFGDWFRNKRKFEALRVKPVGPQNVPFSLTHQMLEAWRTRGPLFQFESQKIAARWVEVFGAKALRELAPHNPGTFREWKERQASTLRANEALARRRLIDGLFMEFMTCAK